MASILYSGCNKYNCLQSTLDARSQLLLLAHDEIFDCVLDAWIDKEDPLRGHRQKQTIVTPCLRLGIFKQFVVKKFEAQS